LNSVDKQYNSLGKSLLEEGVWVTNERTGKRCLTGETVIFTYDLRTEPFSIITSRQAPFKLGVAEVIGYWQGKTSAADFRKLGTKSWDANANLNKAWLENPNRKGEDQMGKVYGYFGHNFGGVNQFEKVYNNLRKGIDDRGEIITYWKPDQFEEGCLRPCLHSVQFNLLGDVLHMTATQRSCDVPLGLVANTQECWFMLELMAQITGNKVGKVTHVINQPHIYEDQIGNFIMQMERGAVDCSPKLTICESVKTWEDVMSLEDTSKFTLTNYEHLGKISFPFSE
tara:strand:- start:117552 stop:118400 length:849 start_codon:yes stop_codon:yes gene_type:complete